MKESSLPVLHDCLWVNFKSICLHQSLQAHLETLALSRLQDLRIILGRLALDCQFQTASRVVSSSSGGISPRKPWLAHQPQEVGSDAHTTPGAPRFCIEYPVNDSATSCTETERHSSFNQASFGQTSSSVSQSDSQLDNADTRSDICNLSGLTIYSTPVLLQESDGESRRGLGSFSSFGSSQSGGTSMVVCQYPQVE